jgi:pimeloyl-ACP methyl ester carboxylesterase
MSLRWWFKVDPQLGGMTHKLVLAVVGSAALLAPAACSSAPKVSDATSRASVTPASVMLEPTARPVPCPSLDGLVRPASCSQVDVPVNYDDPDSGLYALMTMRLQADSPTGPPVVFIPGGPGEAALSEAVTLAAHPVMADRDLVLIDPRGVGYSEPSLACPELNDARVEYFARSSRSLQADLSLTRQAVQECAQRLRGAGIDLDSFGTRVAAADIDRVAQALSIDTWTVWSVSYGTRVAQEVMRTFPSRVTSVVFDSLAPIDELELRPENLSEKVTTALQVAADQCAADSTCGPEFGDLNAAIADVVDRYNETPHVAEINGVTTHLSGGDFVFVLWNMLKNSSTVPLFPLLATSLAQGETALFDEAIAPALDGIAVTDPLSFADGLNYAVDCTDYGSLLDGAEDPTAQSPLVGTFMMLSSGSMCEVLAVTGGDTRFAEPVQSDLPVLVLIGSFDSATPAATARAAAARFSQATVVEFPAGGHSLNDSDECARALTAEWVTSGTVVDIGCVPASVDWVLP